MHQVLLELARRLDGKRPEVSGVIKFNVEDDAIYRLFIEKGAAGWKPRMAAPIHPSPPARNTCWLYLPAS